jgi:two-component system, OmpR family, copper resistance phosphate regulon response regulator CusR
MDMKRAGVSVELGDRAVSGERDDNARYLGDSWPDQVIEVGNLRLHIGRLQADAGSGPVPLTRLEFLFLRELMQHAGEPLSKGRLLSSVWGYEADPGSNVVGVCVRRLRAKLGDHLIKTIRGEGYQLGVG